MSIEEIGLAISIIFAHPVSFAVEGAVFLSGRTFIALSCLSHPKLVM
jgi:hypothetical protein